MRLRPDARLIAEEQRRALETEIVRLPAKLREPIRLNTLDGLGYEEIAQQLGLSLMQVTGLISRGRQLVRQRLTERFA